MGSEWDRGFRGALGWAYEPGRGDHSQKERLLFQVIQKEKAERFFSLGEQRLQDTGQGSKSKGIPNVGSSGHALQTHYFTAPTISDLIFRPVPPVPPRLWKPPHFHLLLSAPTREASEQPPATLLWASFSPSPSCQPQQPCSPTSGRLASQPSLHLGCGSPGPRGVVSEHSQEG